jgi:hypothetical protein
MASTIGVGSELVRVRVGSGSKAHLFRPRPGANAKVFTLRDGGTAYDYVLCGASGALREVDDSVDGCRTCASVLERDTEAAASD